ncbi:hypothetical protein ACI4A4_27920, partial [Klebsiella pneumoniae]|uniref:hypothetical protein n=1 Tax=Klebsiella pneumoniae TaxID=573 RepID=UPI00385370E0
AIVVASFGAAAFLAIESITEVTLADGAPFYDRIWRATELTATGRIPDADYGFWRAAGDAVRLIVRGAFAAVAAWLLGLIPFVGVVLGFLV